MSASSQRTWLGVLLFLAVAGGAGWWSYQQFFAIDMVEIVELNNRGIGWMENFDNGDGYRKAVPIFEEITKKAPAWKPGYINLGIALLNRRDQETGDIERAVTIFERILKSDPKNNHANFCIAMILTNNGQDMPRAFKHLEIVVQNDPKDPHAWYWYGKSLGDDVAKTKECMQKALALDPYLHGAIYEMGMLLREESIDKAKEFLVTHTRLLESQWQSHTYLKYGEMGKYAEVIGRFPRDKTPATGPLPLFGRDDKFQVQLAPSVRWATAADFGAGAEGALRRAIRQRFGGTIVVLDFNLDGRPDFFLASAVVRDGKLGDLLLLNEGDKRFRDVTAEAGLAGLPASLGCAVADYDNDGLPDLLLTGIRGVRLLRNTKVDKEHRFQDVTSKAGLDQFTGVCLGAAFVDLDQDSDLDIVLTQLGATVDEAAARLKNPKRGQDLLNAEVLSPFRGLVVFLNVGEALAAATQTKTAPLDTKFRLADKLLPEFQAAAVNVAVGDLDSDRDVDLFVLGDGEPPWAILNDRLLRFRRTAMADKAMSKGTWNGAAFFDSNRDEKTDLFVVGPGQKPAFLVQGQAGSETWFTAGITNAPPMIQAQAFDIDLDGWTDIIGLSENRKPVLLHNQVGKLVWIRDALGGEKEWPKDIAALIACDVDSDCFPDFVSWSESEGLRLYRNLGNGNHALVVELSGIRHEGILMRCNADAIGARVGAQVRDHWTSMELATLHAGLGQSRQPIMLGLGKATHADFISVRWPDGVWQAELNVATCQRFVVREHNRKGVSCPLLFTWNGKQFEFITDFLGAGSVGEPLPGGGHRPPRAEESVKIEAEQLVPKDGRYVLKFAEPMDEVTYLDRLRLVVVDHPADVRVYPDERFPTETRPATQDLLVFSAVQQIFAKQAKDHRGRDVTQTLRHWDRHTADGFAKRSWIGFAEEHFVELDFGDQLAKFGPKDRLGLFLAGWTDYPFPESIWAAGQAGHSLLSPVLERLGDDGTWHIVRDDLSFPAGLPRMMTYDVSGLVAGPACKLRIRTNMHVYWDQIFIAPILESIPANHGAWPRGDSASKIRLQTLDVADAKLEHRGCVQEFSPDGKQPTVYAYDKLEAVPVTRQAGRLTKFGDVTELLTERDDRFVIFGPGDELTVTFAADKLPPLPAGWKRSFVLRTWGYCKDASPWTATGDTIEPLPFQGMSNFPYGPGERYPQSPLHVEYLQRWQTRQIGTK